VEVNPVDVDLNKCRANVIVNYTLGGVSSPVVPCSAKSGRSSTTPSSHTSVSRVDGTYTVARRPLANHAARRSIVFLVTPGLLAVLPHWLAIMARSLPRLVTWLVALAAVLIVVSVFASRTCVFRSS